MNAQTKIEPAPLTGLDLLRAPFTPNQISKLPKPTKKQTDEVRADFKKGIRCKVCDSWHHPDVIHLDYVGHAALTDRLLDADPHWSWEPCVLPGLPNPGNGMWITLTVCGVSRIGYGSADGKSGGDAVKEIIGDALRNAAMRFGAALDLWHKGDLHAEDEVPQGQSQEGEVSPAAPKRGENWGGRYPTKGKLWAACKSIHAELDRLGREAVLSDLEDFETSPEYSDYVAIALEYAAFLVEGPAPADMPEFIPTFTIAQRARDMIALRGNVPAYEEETN